jgi:hypothetical protein
MLKASSLLHTGGCGGYTGKVPWILFGLKHGAAVLNWDLRSRIAEWNSDIELRPEAVNSIAILSADDYRIVCVDISNLNLAKLIIRLDSINAKR